MRISRTGCTYVTLILFDRLWNTKYKGTHVDNALFRKNKLF